MWLADTGTALFPTALKLGPSSPPAGKTSQSLPTPHNFPRHKPPFTANVSLCVSWAIVVPSLERIDPAACMCTFHIEIDSSAE